MYQDLRSKLELYKSGQTSKPVRRTVQGLDVADVMQGCVVESSGSSFFLLEEQLPADYIYGGCRISSLRELDGGILKLLSGEETEEPNIEDCVFLDTETTGLSSGTGTVAFLVGIGFFNNGTFTIRQYFMRDYDEETAMLKELDGQLKGCKGLVTFNGKAFDWNLLQTRFSFNRLRPSLSDPTHIDLLYPSRKLWKLKLENCRLKSIEESILGETRNDDIPGAMIPGIYFKYLEDRDASDIKKVVEHNRLDIIAMPAILHRIAALLGDPEAMCDGSEFLGAGRIFESAGDYRNVIQCYEACLKCDSRTARNTASLRLGNVYKRSRDYSKAVMHWNSMINESGFGSIAPMVELAKYYEHRERNIPKALEMVEMAIRTSLQTGLRDNTGLCSLKARQQRLYKKAARAAERLTHN